MLSARSRATTRAEDAKQKIATRSVVKVEKNVSSQSKGRSVPPLPNATKTAPTKTSPRKAPTRRPSPVKSLTKSEEKHEEENPSLKNDPATRAREPAKSKASTEPNTHQLSNSTKELHINLSSASLNKKEDKQINLSSTSLNRKEDKPIEVIEIQDSKTNEKNITGGKKKIQTNKLSQASAKQQPRQISEEVEEIDLTSSSQPVVRQPSSSPGTKNKVAKKSENNSSADKKSENNTSTAKSNAQLKEEEVAKELELGRLVVNRMTTGDINTLLENLNAICPDVEFKTHEFRFSVIKWEKIAFGSFSEKECRAAWRILRASTRKYRIMSELVKEVKLCFENNRKEYKQKLVEDLPEFPRNKKYNSSFQNYVKEKWESRTDGERITQNNYLAFQNECKKTFGKMSSSEIDYWNKRCQAALDQYHRDVKTYFEQHPEFSGFIKMYEEIKTREIEIETAKKEKASIPKIKPIKLPRVKLTNKERRRPSLYSTSAKFPDAPQLPMNPQAMFINSKLKRLDPTEAEENVTEYKLKFAQKWNKLSTRKKGKWIDKCINKCEEYRLAVEAYKAEHPDYKAPFFKIVQKVSRNEIGIWETYKGRPTRPPLMVHDLVQNKLMEQEKYSDFTPTQIKEIVDKKFNELSPNDKDLYRLHYKQLGLMYKRDITEFYNNAPDIVKANVYATIPKKFRSGLRLPQSAVTDIKVKSVPDDSSEPRTGPLTAEFVEDSSSSTESPSKNHKMESNHSPIHDEMLISDSPFSLPNLRLDSPERTTSTSTQVDEIKHEVSSPPRKKKKRHDDREATENEYVVGLSGHFSDVPTEENEEEGSVEKKKRKKKKKHKSRQEFEEVEEIVQYNGDNEDFPTFPSEPFFDESDSDKMELTEKQKRKIAKRTSKEYRDKKAEKFENLLRQERF